MVFCQPLSLLLDSADQLMQTRPCQVVFGKAGVAFRGAPATAGKWSSQILARGGAFSRCFSGVAGPETTETSRYPNASTWLRTTGVWPLIPDRACGHAVQRFSECTTFRFRPMGKPGRRPRLTGPVRGFGLGFRPAWRRPGVWRAQSLLDSLRPRGSP